MTDYESDLQFAKDVHAVMDAMCRDVFSKPNSYVKIDQEEGGNTTYSVKTSDGITVALIGKELRRALCTKMVGSVFSFHNHADVLAISLDQYSAKYDSINIKLDKNYTEEQHFQNSLLYTPYQNKIILLSNYLFYKQLTEPYKSFVINTIHVPTFNLALEEIRNSYVNV